MPMFSLRTIVPAVVAALATSACGDSTSPTELTAARFEALADQLGTEHNDRSMALRIAARTLHRGAPVNHLAIAIDGSQRAFDAVAIQGGFITASDTGPLISYMIAWRGPDAEEMITVFADGSVLQFPDTTMPPEDSAVYIGNLNESLKFTRGTTELWRGRSGAGAFQALAVNGSCPAHEGYVCQRRDLDIDFAVVARAFLGGVLQDHTIAMSRTPVHGIRYLVRCPEESCTISMVQELY